MGSQKARLSETFFSIWYTNIDRAYDITLSVVTILKRGAFEETRFSCQWSPFDVRKYFSVLAMTSVYCTGLSNETTPVDEADHFSISEFTVPIQYWIRNDVSR